MKEQKSKLKKWFSLTLVAVFSLTAVLAAWGVGAKKEKTDNPNKISAQERQEIKRELKDFEKAERKSAKEDNEPQAPQGKSNANLHKVNIDTVVENLEEIAEEEVVEDPEVEEDIGEVAEDEEEVQEEVTDAIIAIESRNKFKKFLVGTDYKNLGQLRKNLVHNRNQVRKLNKAIEGVEEGEERGALEEQLTTLTQERERVKTVIEENEEGFSILGWIFKFLYGYPDEPIDEEVEEELLEETVDVIGGEEEEDVEDDSEEEETTEE